MSALSSNSDIIEHIMNNLVCCKCRDTLVYPILHCDLGHSFCKKCYDTKIPCFICGYSCTGSRNHHLERICESLIYFRKFGNNKHTKPASHTIVQKPKENVVYSLSCPMSVSCTFVGTRDQLKFHCVLCHGVKNTFEKNIAKLVLCPELGDASQTFFDAHNTTFLVYVECDLTMVKFAVNNLASNTNERFKFIIRTVNSPDNTELLSMGECVNGANTKRFFTIGMTLARGVHRREFSVEVVRCR